VSRPALRPSILSSGCRGSFFGDKARPGHDADHWPPISCRVEYWVGYIPPLTLGACMVCTGRRYFTFTECDQWYFSTSKTETNQHRMKGW
jgi:hypothetical protein